MENIKFLLANSTCNFFLGLIIIWAADRKTLQAATLPAAHTCAFSPCGVLLSLSRRPPCTSWCIRSAVLGWVVSPPAGTCRKVLMVPFTGSSQPQTKQRRNRDKSQPGTRGHLCLLRPVIASTLTTASQHDREGRGKHRADIQFRVHAYILGSTGDFKTLKMHLGFTPNFSLSNPSLKYKRWLLLAGTFVFGSKCTMYYTRLASFLVSSQHKRKHFSFRPDGPYSVGVILCPTTGKVPNKD